MRRHRWEARQVRRRRQQARVECASSPMIEEMMAHFDSIVPRPRDARQRAEHRDLARMCLGGMPLIAAR